MPQDTAPPLPDEEPGGDRLRVVDAHQHFWDLSVNIHPWLTDPEQIPFRYGDYSAIRRTYLPADYRADWGDVTVDRSVHVEAEWERSSPVAETRWLEGIAAREGLPSVVVGWARLDAPDVDEVLSGHATSPLVRGIRYKPAAAARAQEAIRGAAGSMDDPAFRAGYARLAAHGLSFDLQTPWWHLDAAAELARDFPDTTIILNHTGLPADRSEEGLAAWRRAMERLAAEPNTAVKISGLGLPGRPWTVEANGPVIRDAIAIFGPDRAMFASNYPVDSLVGGFATIWHGFAAAVADRPARERAALLGGNALRIYRI